MKKNIYIYILLYIYIYTYTPNVHAYMCVSIHIYISQMIEPHFPFCIYIHAHDATYQPIANVSYLIGVMVSKRGTNNMFESTNQYPSATYITACYGSHGLFSVIIYLCPWQFSRSKTVTKYHGLLHCHHPEFMQSKYPWITNYRNVKSTGYHYLSMMFSVKNRKKTHLLVDVYITIEHPHND